MFCLGARPCLASACLGLWQRSEDVAPLVCQGLQLENLDLRLWLGGWFVHKAERLHFLGLFWLAPLLQKAKFLLEAACFSWWGVSW